MSDHHVNPPKRLAIFERYLTVWVFLCMVIGVAFGRLAPGFTSSVSRLEFVQGSHVIAPVAVAVAITLFGAGSGAALATVVGVLVEVPVMLSVCKICNQTRGWYQARVSETPATN